MPSRAHHWSLLPVLIGIVFAFLGAPAATQAASAHLDRGFGSGGIRFLSGSLREMTGVALLGDGRVLAAGEHGLVALLPSGRIDPGFGSNGYAPIVQPPAGVVSPSTIAVDRQGRPVEVGTLAMEPKGTDLLTGARWVPFIERFTPAGQIDREFGGGEGYVASDLGLPPSADGEPAETSLLDVAFDDSERLVVSGESRIDVNRGGSGIAEQTTGFLARFDGSGQLDGSFASGGIFSLPGTERFGGWDLGPGGQVTVRVSDEKSNSVIRLGADGVPDPQYGAGGRAPSPLGPDYTNPLVDSKGRTTFYSSVAGVEGRLPNGLVLRRLRPDGSRDRGFGDRGSATVRIPRFYVARLALDSRGRILIAVSLKERGPIGEPKELALARLRTDGELDRSFGHEGLIRIPFPGKPNPAVYLEGIDVRDGLAAIGASYCGRGDCRPSVALVDLGS